ncbi:ATP-grasp domain-containing protein [Nocardioides sp. zg-1228]|uniref:ATP-grasp domain-containing protein n=1 Tax=Nocardioides sp. zg-1228 TaxID=2763008 RepID=UPI00164328D8|nr:ATP-grasp domain-containing protein [Nocardioides sp. zg-1228]MBC2934146.1 ATP-grasp domain-containing protein [Nocardioides sp. zg-1228]QSF58891.1 ATP-grasp domain-containing protein [Nocardioides sp. zg-1228]
MGAASERTTILVTGAAGPAGRALGAQVLARAERGGGLRLLGVDLAPAPVPGYETVLPVPGAPDPAYDEDMRDLVSRLDPDLVVPTVAEELPRLAVLGLAAGMGPGLVLSAPGPVAVAADKLLTMWALAASGVAVPPHATVAEAGSAADAVAWGGGPVVVKPRVSRGGRGVHVVEDGGDPVWDSLDATWLVQGYAPGVEYSPQVYRSPHSGRCRVVVLRKTELTQGRVGNAAAVERLGDGAEPDVEALAVRAVEALDLVGPVDLDVRRSSDGTPVVLEVNSRFGALSAQAPELLADVLAEWTG